MATEPQFESCMDFTSLSTDLHAHPDFGTQVQSLDNSAETECLDDHESDSVIKFLDQILMEENMDEKAAMFHDPLALQATEKSFYDVIHEKYPQSPSVHINTQQPKSPSGGQIDSFKNTRLIPTISSHSESVMHFRKGVEEALKFLPTNFELVFDLDNYRLASKSKTVEKDQSSSRRGRKHLHCQDSNADARSRKVLAVYEDEVEELSELFDKVLLRDVKGVIVLSNGYVKYLNGIDKYWQQNKLPVLRTGKLLNKKEGTEIDVVYLQSLVVSCAQDLASHDFQTAHERLKQIKQYASSTGDAFQRTANIFANSLEARLAATGRQLVADLPLNKISSAEMLKGYQVYLSACPFLVYSRVYATKMILKIAAKASTLHVVDFGISCGFKWPMLIQFLSIRQGGPPKLRITGIDFPQAGLRPAMLIEEACQRLAKYCKRFKVPFEYQTIANQSWDTIDLNDLKLARDESVVVNCQFWLQNLPEEPEVVESPKDVVLKLIRTMKPDLFVHSIVNGSYNTPLFVTRVEEAFLYYSSVFDMLDATLPNNDLHRLHFEKELYGREVMNIIACEGQQRVVRPETYKQWQIRSRRAGFKILPLDNKILSKGKIVASYHKDFLFIEDCNWMLQGWKGRVLYGTSCWVPM